MTILEIADLVRACTNMLRLAAEIDSETADKYDLTVEGIQRDIKILTEFVYDTEFTIVGGKYENH